ncbi:hypothetical protein [Brevundimonas sp. GN22]
MINIRFSVLSAAVVLMCTVPAQAQVNVYNQVPSEVRRNAVCREYYINGMWVNTFGEGRCPPGSRRPGTSIYENDTNSRNLRNTESSVAVLGSLQQSVLAAGQARTNRIVQESIENVKKYKYHHVINESNVVINSLYSLVELNLPLSGEVITANSGDIISYSAQGFYSDCFTSLLDGHKRMIGGHNHHLIGGEFVCKTSSDNEGYTPLYDNYRFQYGNISSDQFLVKRRGKFSICQKDMGMYYLCIDTVGEENIIKSTGFVELVDTVNPKIKFIGFDGDKITFQNVDSLELESIQADEGNRFEVFGMTYLLISKTDGINLQAAN